jgi:hypothetical protein
MISIIDIIMQMGNLKKNSGSLIFSPEYQDQSPNHHLLNWDQLHNMEINLILLLLRAPFSINTSTIGRFLFAISINRGCFSIIIPLINICTSMQ